MARSSIRRQTRPRGRPPEMVKARASRIALVAAALLVAAGSTAAPPGSPPRAGSTSLLFSAEILADLGIEIVEAAETSSPLRDGALAFAVDATRSGLVLDARGDDFEGFSGGDL